MYSYIDMHCDSLLRVLAEGAESLYNGNGMQSIQRMAEAGQMCQFFAIFFRPEWQDEKYFKTLRNALYEQVEAHADVIGMAHNYAEIQANRSSGRASAILTIEDGRMVGGRMEKLKELHAKGVRAITLTWNAPNCFGYPHSTDKRAMCKGLTAFGREAVQEMNRLGILIDTSHLSDGGFFDVAALSDKPFVASHSNCRALTPHTRNLNDDMIVLLAERGGVAGVNLYPPFVNNAGKQRLLWQEGCNSIMGTERMNGHRAVSELRTEEAAFGVGVENCGYIEALAAHILHFIKVGGEECVGIGTDFDGMEEDPEIDCPTKMELLFDKLLKKGMTPRQLDKFTSGNVLRVIKETMK